MCEEKLLEIAEKYGFELKKELKYRCGYCYEFHLVNAKDTIYAGYAGNHERYFLSEKEIVQRIKNGKSSEEMEREELLRDHTSMIEKEMLA